MKLIDHKNPVKINTVRIKKERLDVEYPQVEGLSNKDAQQYINAVILSIVNNAITNTDYYDNPETNVTVRYHIRTNEKGILSVSIETFWIVTLAANGMTVLTSVTFNVNTGRIYRLEDLFRPGSDYVRRLTEIIKRQITEREIPLLVEFKSIAPDQDFYIEGKTLNIYFQLFALAAHVYGFLTFPIPYPEIADIVRQDGPLGILRG